MALGVRLKKSLNGGKSFGRRKSEDFDSNGNDSHRKHNESEERRSRFTEKKFSRRGGDSNAKEVGRKPGYTKPRSSGRNEYGEGRGGSFDSSRNDSYRRYSERGEKFSRRGGDSDAKEVRRKPGYVKPRSFGRNGYSEGRGGSFDSNGNDSNCKYSERGERSSRRGGASDGKEFGREPRRYVRNEYDESRRSDGASGEMRGHRGKRDERIPFRSEVIDQLRSRGERIGLKKRKVFGMRNRKKRDDSQEEDMDENSDSVEASSDKFKLKWKKMDKKHKDPDEDSSISERSDRTKGKRVDKGDSKDKVVEENSKSEGRDDQVAEQKSVRHQTRVLNKFGKKIRVERKSSDDGSAERVAPLKKKKRVIKIDPYDISNKRLDGFTPTEDHAEKSEENESEISKNAQFRAIQPSPSILSFVEDNLLGRRRLNELKDAGYNIKLSAPLDNVPFSTSIERERIEDNVFRNKLEFFAAAKISSSFPPPVLPEIAFAGRSNVGKSSMLNALTRQWGVVRTSDKPGLTQTINFFKLASKLCLVDLPGYGFAYAKEEVKDAWEELVKEYVSTRVGLHRVCLLIDTKWGMKPRDHELIDLMERSQTPYQIVLTKTDLVFPIDVARRAMQIQESLRKNKSIVNPVMMASSKSGAGVRNLRTVLSKITRFIKP